MVQFPALGLRTSVTSACHQAIIMQPVFGLYKQYEFPLISLFISFTHLNTTCKHTMPNTTNNAIPSNLDAFPAQKVGGMRVKNPDARRTSLKDESKDASKTNEAEEEDREDEEYEEEQQRMRRRALE